MLMGHSGLRWCLSLSSYISVKPRVVRGSLVPMACPVQDAMNFHLYDQHPPQFPALPFSEFPEVLKNQGAQFFQMW